MAARVCVVADVRDAVWGEMGFADVEDPFANRRGHPRIQPMGDDVVELAKTRIEVHQIELLQADVREPELIDQLLATRDGRLCKINAGEMTLWQGERHGNQVSTIATGQFQNSATIDGGRRHAKQRADDREA